MRPLFTSALYVLVALAVAVAAIAGCAAAAPLPPRPSSAETERAARAFVAAMKPQRAGRPVVAVLASNEGTETTDFLLTHGVLSRADVADVQAVAPQRGRVTLYPALQVDGALDLESFDRAHPAGADYVIVPAMRDDNDPAITAWLKRQAERGARIVGVCVGALVLGRAGLLDGRRFTTHWYSLDSARERHPSGVYVPHLRYVVDRGVATTTGITASVPTMLALVEALGGRAKAQQLATELGVDSWGPAHDSSRFGLDASRRWNYVLNKAAFWRHEQWRVEVHDGIDEVALAFAADAWSRTGRVSVEASAPRPVKLRSGLQLVARPAEQGEPRLPLSPAIKPIQQLDRTLCEIRERFGAAREDWVAIELEYAGAAGCAG
jgi:putative intracellular protease/amidase